MAIKTVEIWADSFHEGVWCCDNICLYLKSRGYSYKLSFINGFIPTYQIFEAEKQTAVFYVYGSYKTWTPMPQTIKDLIEWGKPDFVAYDPEDEEIWFAVEETAAVPTGNQAMQRCERQYGSARAKIPYWYFVSEFGEHVDGGVRRDNIWPTIAAINELSLKDEVEKLESQGIVHAIRCQKDLEEAPGAYKDIDEVMANQKDLVKIVTELTPIAVVKGL